MRLCICLLAMMLSLPLQAQEQEPEGPRANAQDDCTEFPLACKPPNPPSWGGSDGGIAAQEDPDAEIDMQAIERQLEIQPPAIRLDTQPPVQR